MIHLNYVHSVLMVHYALAGQPLHQNLVFIEDLCKLLNLLSALINKHVWVEL